MEKLPIMKDLFTQGIKNNIEKKTNEFLTNKKELATIQDNIKSNIERFTKILKDHDNTLTTEALKEIKALEKDILSTSEDSYDIKAIFDFTLIFIKLLLYTY